MEMPCRKGRWQTNDIRKHFGKIRKIVDIPDLIGMQRESYDVSCRWMSRRKNARTSDFRRYSNQFFPSRILRAAPPLNLSLIGFGEVKHGVQECIHRGMTYELPIRITVRLVVYDVDKESGVSNIRDIKEQEIYFGTVPLMTEKGTFIINGTERVVVSQLHRSSGVFFDHDKGKTHSSGKIIYTSRIIPVRGSWIDLEIDPKDIVYIRIDRRRKFPVTTSFQGLRLFGARTCSHTFTTRRKSFSVKVGFIRNSMKNS